MGQNLEFRILEAEILKWVKILNSGFWKAKMFKSVKILNSGFWKAKIFNAGF